MILTKYLLECLDQINNGGTSSLQVQLLRLLYQAENAFSAGAKECDPNATGFSDPSFMTRDNTAIPYGKALHESNNVF